MLLICKLKQTIKQLIMQQNYIVNCPLFMKRLNKLMNKQMNKLLVYQIIQDKKVIKIKRYIAIIQLKQERQQDALDEHYETENLEIKVYGKGSVQVAKTQKIIGFNQEFRDAVNYFQKNLKSFEENGMKKEVVEDKQKIKCAKEIKEKGKFYLI